MAKNQVIAGEYQNKAVIGARGKVSIVTGFGKVLNLNQTTVESYEHKSEDHKKGTHVVSIEFKDGKKSLIEIDGNVYKALIQAMFQTPSTSAQGNINTGVTAKKRKGCLPIGCLLIVILFVAIPVYFISKDPGKYNTAPKDVLARELDITVEQAEDVIEVFKSVGVSEKAEAEHDEMLDNAHFEGEKGYRLSNTGVSGVILYMNADGVVYNIRYTDNDLYKEGKVISKLSDFVIDEWDKSKLRNGAMEYVNKHLKSPSTAEYPNLSEWKFAKKEGQTYIQGYVDSQNGFGATIRSEFQLIIQGDDVKSFIFEGKEWIK